MTPQNLADKIIEIAKIRQSEPATASSDLVAAIHGLWLEIGLILGREMERIRREERILNMRKK